MSTASPLPLQPLPPSTLSAAEAHAFKQEVASKLAEHRQRRPRSNPSAQVALPLDGTSAPRQHIASSVAARFSKRESYREFLQHEAEAAIQQAHAEAEVACRTASAIVAAQQQLLDEIDQWNAPGVVEKQEPAVLFTTGATVPPVSSSPLHAFTLEPSTPELPLAMVIAYEDLSSLTTQANAAQVQPATNVANQPISQAALTHSPVQRETEPLEPSVALPTNLIEFPRQLVAARRARPRLAEGPLRDEADTTPERAQLRIFEVEANSVSTVVTTESVLPEWHTIRLEAQEQIRDTAHPGPEVSFALPLYVAPRSQRAMATLVDGCCVMAAFLLAVAVAVSVCPVAPSGLPALLATAPTLFILWLFYQCLFFSLSDATPGMRYARIALCTFGDENPTRASTLRRIGARLLAGMPLGLGLLWACLDDEGLGWHDRISRMYPRAY